MNIFDAGGLVSFVALVMSVIIGIGIYILLNSMFEIVHFGFGAVISFFLGCVVAGAFIVNWFSGLILGFFSVLWFLIRVGLFIGGIVFIYLKFKSNKNEGDTKVE